MIAGDELCNAAFEGNLPELASLLGQGVPVDSRDSHGSTPLINSLLDCNLEVFETLLAAGADVNLTHPRAPCLSPLHIAACECSLDIVEKLLASGAAVNCRASNGSTPLMWAARGNQLAIMKRLVAAGANIVLKNDDGATALDIAKKKNAYNSIDYLSGLHARLEMDAGLYEVDSEWSKSFAKIMASTQDESACMKDAVDEMYALCRRLHTDCNITKPGVKQELKRNWNGNFRIERDAFRRVFKEIEGKWMLEDVAPRQIGDFFEIVAHPHEQLDCDIALDVLKKFFDDSADTKTRKLAFTRTRNDWSEENVKQMISAESIGDETITKQKFVQVALDALFQNVTPYHELSIES